MDYKTALDWLYAARLRGLKFGLENTCRLLDTLGHPEESFRIIHVAGTNGKGSTCAMIESLCRAAGYRTGLFTSPHLVTFLERIRVNGIMAQESDVAQGLTRIREVVKDWESAPTFFELATVLALDHFRSSGVEVAVLETGMGGRLDATNVCLPVACAITPIGLDHMQWLGETIEAIAAEKAGIIKPGIPVVCAPQIPDAEAVIRTRAMELGAPFLPVGAPWPRWPRHLPGTHQCWNAATAVATVVAAGVNTLPKDAVGAALDATVWPGRFQRFNERLILDGAHNQASAATLAATWREVFPDSSPTLVIGVLADKDASAICAELAPLARQAVVTCPPGNRAMPADELAVILRQVRSDLDIRSVPDPREAIDTALAQDGPCLVAGSLFLVGSVLAYLGNDAPQSPQPNDM